MPRRVDIAGSDIIFRLKHGSYSVADGVVVEMSLGRKKAAEQPSSDKYTIFHALVEALEDKEKGKRSFFRRFKLRK